MIEHERDSGAVNVGPLMLYRPACSCGWRARLPRATAWGHRVAHAKHVLAASGGDLSRLYLAPPGRWAVEWQTRVDEVQWADARIILADPDGATLVADLLDNLPAAVRYVRLVDLGTGP